MKQNKLEINRDNCLKILHFYIFLLGHNSVICSMST